MNLGAVSQSRELLQRGSSSITQARFSFLQGQKRCR
jgi:hypothetical protein